MKSSVLLFSLLLAAGHSQAQQSVKARPYYYDASLSPDGQGIVFVSGGDIWTVPASGGDARLLTAHPAMETRPLYSPDGRYLAFNSTRSGNGDIYLLDLKEGKVNRLTYDDASEELNGWSPDGQYIYFSSTGGDIAGMRDVYRINAKGGTPMPVSNNRFMAEFFAVPSPDGKTIAMSVRGMGAGQWWRNGHSHIDESEIWLLDEPTGKYTLLSGMGAKQLWPMWSADGQTVYYVSDRDGKENIWMHPVQDKPVQVTHFKNGRVSFPSISKDGKSMVFEHDFGIWKMDMISHQVQPLNINLIGAATTSAAEFQKLSSGFGDLTVSPDGRKLAFTAQGELFVAGTKDGGDATRITYTQGMESSPVWAKNSNKIYYVSDKDGKTYICQYNFITGKETQLTYAGTDEGSLMLSPDGKKLAFIRKGKDLTVLDFSDKEEILLVSDFMSFSPVRSEGSISWSPDSKWIAYASHGNKSFRNIYVIPAVGGTPEPVSFLANTFGGAVAWGKDGKSILFLTSQRTENGQVVRIDMEPRQPRFIEDQFRNLFSDSAAPSGSTSSKSGSITFDGIRDRLSLLPLGVDVAEIEISNDKNTLLVMASIAGQTNLYTWSLDDMAKEPPVLKQITFSPGGKSNMQFSSDDKEVYYLEGGKVYIVNIDSKQNRQISLTAGMSIDFNARKMEVFRQTWELQHKGFYDEHFHGTDWQEVKSTYAPYAAGAQTPEELRRILNMMVGELNASHSGVSGTTQPANITGHLGLKFDRRAYEREGLFKITEVIALSPAALTGKIEAGDYLQAVDGISLDKKANLDQLLENKMNRRVLLSVMKGTGEEFDDDDENTIEVAVKPVSLGAEKGLLYQQWVQTNRAKVGIMSGGRLGYVHMADMTQGSLDKLYLDLDAQNHNCEGVVIDIRNNNGGFVNAYALDVLSRRGYMTMTARGLPSAPARLQLGQRALDAPTILLTNQHSLSDAEDFSEGYRALGLGKIVGEPTAGWIIYTTNINLFDGTSVRLPFIKITDNKGKNMELAPRPVDITVSNDPGAKTDKQLKVAVQELLKQLERKP